MPLSILIVDDEESIRKVLAITLADSGYEVHTAADGHKALSLLKKRVPDIVLTDIKMPGISGLELLKTIKNDYPDVEVIMISGHGDMELAIKSLKRDATDFLTKPIHEDNLEIAMKRACERIDMRRKLREYTLNLEKLAEERAAQLRTTEYHYQQLFDSAPCYITVQDRDYRLISANKKFRDDFDPPAATSCHAVYKNQDTPCQDCPVQKTFLNGKSYQGEMRVTDKNGAPHHLLITTSPITPPQGQVVSVMELSTDITQLRKLEDHLAAIGLQIGTISHGIKGMLTGLDSGMYLLETGFEKNEKTRVQEGWEIVRHQVKQIREMILKILYATKERKLRRQPTEIVSFFKDLAATFAHKMKQHAIDFAMDLNVRKGGFDIDPSALRIALINILENSLDACLEKNGEEKPRILLRVGLEDAHVICDIIDNGIGMEASFQKELFSLFHSSKGVKGTGLGLYIAHSVIKNHQGRIEVHASPNQGCHFRIHLPQSATAPLRP